MRIRRAIVSLALVASMAVPVAAVGGVLTAGAVGAAAVPGPPRSVYSLPWGNGGAKVIWKAPTSTGGSVITAYRVTPYVGTRAGLVRVFNSKQTSGIVQGLADGRSYRFKVAAQNAVGTGRGQRFLGALVVGVPGQAAAPKMFNTGPGELTANRGQRPMTNGAVPIFFTTTCVSSNGGTTKSSSPEKDIAPVVSGLTVGKTYRCTDVASNKYGPGLRSKPSAPITA